MEEQTVSKDYIKRELRKSILKLAEPFANEKGEVKFVVRTNPGDGQPTYTREIYINVKEEHITYRIQAGKLKLPETEFHLLDIDRQFSILNTLIELITDMVNYK